MIDTKPRPRQLREPGPEHTDVLVPSRRKTSNSRGPGQEGTVYFARVGIVTCPKCGGKRYDADTPHSPHYRPGRGLVDCVGDVIPQEAW